MKVRALRLGYYDNKRRRAGEVFTIKPLSGKRLNKNTKKLEDYTFSPKEQLGSWMEVLDEGAPLEQEGAMPPVKKASQRSPQALSKKEVSQKVTDLEVI